MNFPNTEAISSLSFLLHISYFMNSSLRLPNNPINELMLNFEVVNYLLKHPVNIQQYLFK